MQNAWFAKLCAMLSKPGPLDDFRCPLAQSAGVGQVLELGPGAGANFRCLTNATGISSYVTVEPNDKFTSVLLAEATKQNLPFSITPTWLKGEQLDVEAASFDSVLATHVLCSVGDAVPGLLKNVDSALKVGGTFVSMEHVAAESGSTLSMVQKLIGPAFSLIANGCEFKDAEKLVREHLPASRYDLSVEYFEAPMPLAPFVPHVAIKATKLA